MSSPFRIDIYNDKELVDQRYGNHGWISPNEIGIARNIVNVILLVDFNNPTPTPKEWTHFVTMGRIFFKEEFEIMSNIVKVIDDFKIDDFTTKIEKPLT